MSWGKRLILIALLCHSFAYAQNVFNCTAWVNAGSAGPGSNKCAVAPVGQPAANWALAGGTNSVIATSGITEIPAGQLHNVNPLIYQTAVNVQAFTFNVQFTSNAQNFSIALQNNNNPNVDGGATHMIGGAGGEAGIFQGFGTIPPSPNNLWGIVFDAYSGLTQSAAFTNSGVQLYQQVQIPGLPAGAEDVATYPTNHVSTLPVNLSGPTQNSCKQTVANTCDTYSATVTYDGSTVTLNLFDVTAGGACPGATCFTQTWLNVNIPGLVDGTTAYFTLTGATGIAAPGPLTVISASYTVNTPTATPGGFAAYNSPTTTNNGTVSVASPTYSVVPEIYASAQTVTISDGTAGANICYVLASAGTVPTQLPTPNNIGGCTIGTPYTSPVTISSSQTLYAAAGVAYTNPPSPITAGTYTINPSAASCALTNGANQSAIVNAMAIAGAGNCLGLSASTINFAAGTYGPISGTQTIPCNVNFVGPTVPYSQTPNQTAVILGTTTFIGWAFQTTVGCGNMQNIEFLEWNGEQPTITGGGGGFLQIRAGTTNFTVTNNYLHGVVAPSVDTGNSQNLQANLINFTGGLSGGNTQNVFITWNVFGKQGDCAGSITETSTEAGGGYCNGVGIGANVLGVTVQHNIFQWMEQGAKFYEAQGQCYPLTLSNNDFHHIQRIMYETQCNNTTGPMHQIVQYNSFHDRLTNNGGQQNYDLSLANGCTNPSLSNPTNCVTNGDYNLDVAVPTCCNVGFEYWGGAGSTGNGNFLQGYLYNGITWSYSGQYTFNNNVMNLINNGNNQNCQAHAGGFWNSEKVNGAYPPNSPSCSGNMFSNNITGTTASTAPQISPASGSFSGSQQVTLTNPGIGFNVNTSIWYTVDGCTPIPGAVDSCGTNQTLFYSAPITITTTTTVKAVGMWGSLNQPYSYTTNYGMVPSSPVSATYTAGGVAATPSFSPPAPYTFAPPSQSVSITDSTSGSTIYYTTDGTTPTTSSTQYTGPITLTGTTTLQAIATAAGLGPSAVASGVYTMSAPTLTGCTQSNAGGLSTSGINQQVQQVLTCNYASTGQSLTCSPNADVYGDVVKSWTVTDTNIAIGAIGSGTPGLVTGTHVGTAAVNATAGSAPVSCSAYNFTVAAPTLTGVSISLSGGGTSLTTGSQVQACATMTYSGLSPTVVCGTGSDEYGTTPTGWSSSSGGVATISTSGLVTGVSAGSTNISVSAGSFTATPETITVTTLPPASILSGSPNITGSTGIQ